MAIFRQNSLHIKYGLYYPKLGNCDRIISVSLINQLGWNVSFDTSDPHIADGNYRAKMFWLTDRLPYTHLAFDNEQAIHETQLPEVELTSQRKIPIPERATPLLRQSR